MSFDKILGIPFKSGGLVKLIIGGLFQLIPIASFFTSGYLVKCFEFGALDIEEMPEWEDWGKKFIDGFLVAVISLIYLFIPILFAIFMRNHGFGAFIIAAILYIIFAFTLPMAISNYAVQKNFSAAFDFGYIIKLIGASFGCYIGAYLLCLLVMIIWSLFCMVIALIPILGWVIVVILSVYPACVCGFLFGATYSRAIIAAGNPAGAVQGAINSAAEQAASKELTFCSSCGARLNAGGSFCKICGDKIE